MKVRSSRYEEDVFDIGYKAMSYGDKCPKDTLLRPHIVWFGESVPLIEQAVELVEKADILIIVGTSLEVYPAAGLLYHARPHCRIYLVDPNRHEGIRVRNLELIQDTAAKALPELVRKLKGA